MLDKNLVKQLAIRGVIMGFEMWGGLREAYISMCGGKDASDKETRNLLNTVDMGILVFSSVSLVVWAANRWTNQQLAAVQEAEKVR